MEGGCGASLKEPWCVLLRVCVRCAMMNSCEGVSLLLLCTVEPRD